MEPIAVVGMAARFPQDASSIEGFWSLIHEGRRVASEIPEDRINMDAFYHPNPDRSDTTNVRKGHFLAGDVAAFDAPFFSIQPIEAQSMDPQQRILLETSYSALENAGIPMEKVTGSRAAVFFAASTRDYEVMLYRDPELPPKYMGTGIGTSLLANRVSWFFGFLGPSVTLDTACSGSLTAAHLACQSLRNRECSMALAGGGALMLSPEVTMSQLSTLGFLSPDGQSYSFDSRANGYARGEGLGMMVLKRVDDALRDGDTIRAIIRSTAINQDGRTPGITQPSKRAQTDNIIQAYEAARLSLDQTKYFEAHGTGTAIGDPFEAEAIHHAFRRNSDNPLYLGSVKANIGHLEAGAGIAALIKSVLILENGILPPNAGFERHNPAIPIDEWSLRFLNSAIPFPDNGLRRISVNSFGYGGANGHAILDDALHYLEGRNNACQIPAINGYNTTQTGPQLSEDAISLVNGNEIGRDYHTSIEAGKRISLGRPVAILLLSAADEAGVQRLAATYENYFNRPGRLAERAENQYLANLVYTLSNKRSSLPWKAFAVARSLDDLRTSFKTTLSKPFRSSTAPSISYMFTGQGAQWYAMADGLFGHSAFLESLQRSQGYLKDNGAKWTLMDEFQKTKESSRVDESEISQPLCTALQIALVDLLASWQLQPAAVTGHSSGEIAAAYCVGALSHESAIKIAYYRGIVTTTNLVQRLERGAMMAIGLSEGDVSQHAEEAMRRSGGRLSVGCVNSPKNVTVTGDVSAIEVLRQMMDNLNIFARKLQVPVAYHSHHMEDLAGEYRSKIQHIQSETLKEGSTRMTPIFSSVTGQRAVVTDLSMAEYWVRNLTSKVRFSESLSQMAGYLSKERGESNKSSQDLLLELGPHPALQRSAKDTLQGAGAKGFDFDYLLSRETESPLALANAMGRLRCRGCWLDLTKVGFSGVQAQQLQTLTDLPPYSFNHSQSYWTESRLSRNFKFRQHPRHELLGTREIDWNPLQPKWRNVIRIAEHPWIHDHKFRGTCLLPAAAMLAMPIEAVRQLERPNSELSSYQLNDVVFPSAFVIPPNATIIEAQMHFYPHQSSGKGAQKHSDFHIFAFLSNAWKEICSGSITAEIRLPKGASIDRGKRKLGSLSLGELSKDGFAKHWETISSSQFYENLVARGYDFGPTFQSLDELCFTEDGQSSAKVTLDDWIQKIENPPSIADHVIHPTDLDAIFQTSVAAYSQGSRLAVPILVPTKIKSLWISSDLLYRAPAQKVKVLTKTSFRGFREADFSMGAVTTENKVQVLVEGFRQTVLDDNGEEKEKDFQRSCYHVDWKPDVDLLSRAEIVGLCEQSVDSSLIPSIELVDRQELVTLYYMRKALADMPKCKPHLEMPHLIKYMTWIQRFFDPDMLEKLRKGHRENEKLFGDDANREEFLSKFRLECIEGKLIEKIGNNFVPLMNGQLDIREMLFGKDNVLDAYYASDHFKPSFTRLTTYINLVAHKNQALNILEVGAGRGFLTGAVLKSLTAYTSRLDGRDDIPKLQHYTFTDISPGFFEQAKINFQKYSNLVSYAVFDLEKDPLDQGFRLEQFDMVIASLVLHAAANIGRMLHNIRKVLKPGGKLILFEPCASETARISFIFGILPGWWLSEEKERQSCPLLDASGWHRTLLKNGFSGVDVDFPDQEDQSRLTFSGFVSTAVQPQATASETLGTFVVAAKGSPSQQNVAQDIQEALSTATHQVRILTLDELSAHDLGDAHCISLLELGHSFFENIGEKNWDSFKRVVASVESILWVTQSCSSSCPQASQALITGLGRAIKSEYQDAQFLELALDFDTSEEQAARQVLKAYKSSLAHEGLLEYELAEQGGQLCIGRLVEATSPNGKIHDATTLQRPVHKTFGSHEVGLKLTVETPGLPESLRFEDDPLHDQPLQPTEVEIEVRASGVNFKDVLIVLGQLAANVLGSECSGTVVRAGSESGYQPGDAVCACTTTGGYKTFVRTDSSAVIRVPDTLSLDAAAGIPTVFATAYYSLVILANVQEGESVLIHLGAGGVGQAAIQLARRLGARIFTTVGSKPKKELLMKLYDIPEDHIFGSRDTEFAADVMSMTGSGVDVVLNSLSGEGQRASWACLAPLGRFVELGKADIESPRKALPMAPFAFNVSFHSVSLDIVMDKAKPLMHRITSAISSLLADQGSIHTPQPLHVYQVSKIEDAFRFMQSGKNDGKIVIEMSKSDYVPILPSLKPSYYFHSDATYVLAGGLGGLGRTIVQYMADRKARNFLLLSRSGTAGSEETTGWIESMKARGLNISAPRCDVTDDNTVAAVMEECRKTMPHIKGCIQGSMVLKDSLLETTTVSDLHDVLRPKTIGTVNLHRFLPKNLDFFVLLSSIASMTGSHAQANYAAASTFQDAFARHLVATGQPCISLNLGAILSVGFAAEHNLTSSLRRRGFEGISKFEFFALLEWACDPNCAAARNPRTAHLVTGLASAQTLAPEQFRSVYWTSKPMFQPLLQLNAATHNTGRDSAESAIQTNDFAGLIATAEDADTAKETALAALMNRLAALLAIPHEDVDPQKAITAFGVDSLVALELRQWINKHLRADVNLVDIMHSASVEELAAKVVTKSELTKSVR